MTRNIVCSLVWFLVCAFAGIAQGAVSISEVMAKNDETIKTPGGKAELDWIELRNDGVEDVDVTGWYLSDNPTKKPEKWKRIVCDVPAIVPAEGYLLVWADKDFVDFAAGEPHVAIGLSTDGERIFLAPPETEELDEDLIFEFGPQIKDVSYGLDTNGVVCYFREPTPGAANTTQGFGPPTPAVTLSEAHGFKTAPFALTMTASDPAATIYYTTNGVEPTVENAVPYDGTPLIIDHTSFIRATVPDPSSVRATVTTATYLFVEDILEQGPNPGGDFPTTNKVNSQTLEFGLNAGVVSAHRAEVAVSLTNSIPVYSIVGDVADFFDANKGIYVNATGKGQDWERKASVELFDPLAREVGFQIDCGVKMRGAASRRSSPKHSFRFVFRSEYGTGKLNYPLFGDEGVKSFDKIDLRTDQNISWASDKSGNASFVHDVFCRDVQRDQGRPYARSRFCHLFLNGQYWGLYQTEERDDSCFATSYLGGNAEDWDFVRTTLVGGTFRTDAVDGKIDSFLALMKLVNSGVDDAMYHRMMGQNPDGTDNLEFPVYLDDENLMDFVIGVHYEHDPDSPWSVWNSKPNNMHCLYNRNARQGFVWVRHDAEYSMGKHTFYKPAKVFSGRWGDLGSYSQHNFTPNGLHARLADRSPRYRRKFAERLDAQMFQPNGVLSKDSNIKRLDVRIGEVSGAIWAEAARWGRGQFTPKNWTNGCNSCKAFINERTEQMRTHYVNAGWYPTTLRPVITTPQDETDFYALPVELSCEEGKILCWTDDGSDPAESLTVKSNGLSSATYVIGTNSVVLTARAYDPGKDEWSLLATKSIEVTPFTTADRQRMYLRVAELNLIGEPFMTITNLSDRFELPLDGLMLGRFLSGEQTGLCPPLGVVKIALDATDDLSAPVELVFASAATQTIQALRVSADWPGFGDTRTGDAYFVARGMGTELLGAENWIPWLGMVTDEDVRERVVGAVDPLLVENIQTLSDGERLVYWAARNGRSFGDVLTNEHAYLSFALDTPGFVRADWVSGLTDGDLVYNELLPSVSDGFTYSVNLRGLSVGEFAPGEHMSKFFTVLGSPTLLGEFTVDNVEMLALPAADGEGGVRFKVAPAPAVSPTKHFFIRTVFCPCVPLR